MGMGPDRQAAKRSDAFDTWLERSLQDQYASVMREPIPQALLDMIEDDARANDTLPPSEPT